MRTFLINSLKGTIGVFLILLILFLLSAPAVLIVQTGNFLWFLLYGPLFGVGYAIEENFAKDEDIV